jgi:hypothetical protein
MDDYIELLKHNGYAHSVRLGFPYDPHSKPTVFLKRH